MLSVNVMFVFAVPPFLKMESLLMENSNVKIVQFSRMQKVNLSLHLFLKATIMFRKDEMFFSMMLIFVLTFAKHLPLRNLIAPSDLIHLFLVKALLSLVTLKIMKSKKIKFVTVVEDLFTQKYNWTISLTNLSKKLKKVQFSQTNKNSRNDSIKF